MLEIYKLISLLKHTMKRLFSFADDNVIVKQQKTSFAIGQRVQFKVRPVPSFAVVYMATGCYVTDTVWAIIDSISFNVMSLSNWNMNKM